MRPIALDTNTYVGFKRGDAACLELVAGFACGDREARNREELRRFLAVAAVEVVPISLETADSYSLLYCSLRQQGTPIPSNDLSIAASSLEHGAMRMLILRGCRACGWCAIGRRCCRDPGWMQLRDWGLKGGGVGAV